MEEIVALYAQDELPGRVVGSAPRSRMRARNLSHAAAKTLVRDVSGQVYVHRRTDTKDLYPGLYDVWVGGVIAAGEEPDNAAERELAEELGVKDCTVRLVDRHWFTNTHTNFLAHIYETVYEPTLHGPIAHQPEEVAEGWWLPWDGLKTRLADPDWPFVPDGRALLASYERVRGA
ncbi:MULTISPECIES: NUDIX domain-containing protein [unclassified Streptomyces]|uniref:NUDIX domain-containing protein n=1 Tax=unclassified Streptomyces TaxID=2593676 RepID=UPI000451FF01|nr:MULTISPECIES: NUDIX domain-containing protein [unclassified Streptomyces]EXU62125.1 NUDIX hydrolase [Streptomyces sp. PRh5]TMU98317.1 NUDIX domain-containing protein [Streptomyces sp. DASNCL29]